MNQHDVRNSDVTKVHRGCNNLSANTVSSGDREQEQVSPVGCNGDGVVLGRSNDAEWRLSSRQKRPHCMREICSYGKAFATYCVQDVRFKKDIYITRA